MKNLNRILFVPIAFFAMMAFFLAPTNAYSQKKTKEETVAAFPQPVSGIFNKSCVGCHSDMSRSKGKEFLNLSEWDKLTSKKQAKTGKSIDKMVKKGKMPPEDVVKRFPQAALTADEVKDINEWAHSVKKHK